MRSPITQKAGSESSKPKVSVTMKWQPFPSTTAWALPTPLALVPVPYLTFCGVIADPIVFARELSICPVLAINLTLNCHSLSLHPHQPNE